MPPSTTTHHQPKYIDHHPPLPITIHHHPTPAKIYPPPPTTSQNISTTTHHQPKYIYHHTPSPRNWTTSKSQNIFIYCISSFLHCFNSFFFYEMQYSFCDNLNFIFCVIKFWTACFSNSKFLLHFTIYKIFEVYILRV